MQNTNEDTEWNDVLRAKGILPAKEKEITEQDIVQMVEDTVSKKVNGRSLGEMNLDELDELEDDEDERVLLEYRQKRIEEMRAAARAAKYGEVREISAEDYVTEVNRAGDGIWVVLHLYKQGIPLCTLINQHLTALAGKFPATKFLKSISTTCIPNYPDKNLPTLFVYHEGAMKGQLIGPMTFGGMNLKIDELEWMLSQTGAVKTTLESDPRPQVRDVLMAQLGGRGRADSDEDDW
ncbi:viral IAP-associated factor homolog [Pollicipes pollicipes]|uniref:viral IAP-associated factor homolog n=1 Tax=Pollicipes pollicipes TaxID=41117 RepID=UPI001884D905|nr:viral IAP-associated factor homolog [Pollicipes pollicipes]